MRRLLVQVGITTACTACSALAPETTVEPTLGGGGAQYCYDSHPEIGQLLVPGEGSCTAILVGPRAVLSAAHCVGYQTGIADPATTFAIFSADGTVDALAVRRIHSFAKNLGRDDLALLELVEAVPPGVAVPAQIGVEYPAHGDTVTVSGFGANASEKRGERDVWYGGAKRCKRVPWNYRHGEEGIEIPGTAALGRGDSGGAVRVDSDGPIIAIASARRGAEADIFADVIANHEGLEAQVADWASVHAVEIAVWRDTALIARLADGTVWIWDDPMRDVAPTQVPGLTGTRRIASGYYHACAAIVDGTAVCWGENRHGELGDGTTLDHADPVQVAGLSDVVDVTVGRRQSCARHVTGEISCWGKDNMKQNGEGWAYFDSDVPLKTGIDLAESVSSGDGLYALTCVLRQGRVVCLGEGSWRMTPQSWNDVMGGFSQVEAGWYHACGLRSDGTVWCWGSGGRGQLGPSFTEEDGVVSPPAGDELVQIPLGAAAKAIELMHDSSCALMTDGTAICWGQPLGKKGALRTIRRGDRDALGVVQIAMGREFSCGLFADGTVGCGGIGAGRIDYRGWWKPITW